MKKHNYIRGALILIITNLTTAIIAFLYRILLSRTLGAEGMGVFQLILPFYSLLITLVSGGITTAVSKKVSELNSQNKINEISNLMRSSKIIIGVWSIILCLLIAFNSKFISEFILRDQRTNIAIIVTTPAIFFISLSSIYRGYFFGLEDVYPAAIIDIVEKLIRLLILYIQTSLLIPYGIEYVCIGAMSAMTIGELFSTALLSIIYNAKNKINKKYKFKLNIISVFNIIKTALPLSISGALHTIMDMISAILIPSQLLIAGYDYSKALSLYGELTGMVMPLLFFPFIFVLSLGITLVPAIAYSYARKNWVALNKKSNDAIKITAIFGFLATAIFLTYPNEICQTIYNNGNPGKMLFWISLGGFFEYLIFICFSIMNALGMQNKVLIGSVLSIIISIFSIIKLIPIPKLGIFGYIIGFNFSTIIILIFCYKTLKDIPKLSINFTKNIIKPLICFSGMMLFIIYLKIIMTPILVSIICSIVLYFILIIITRTITIKQIKGIFHTEN